ncbi:MAG: RHS repeat-associated core domain-containing protein [Bryobacteraceae bacterium]
MAKRCRSGSTDAPAPDLGTRPISSLKSAKGTAACHHTREELAISPGGTLDLAGLARVPQQFTGKERDAESGLDFFGARYYGSSLGRFTSPDPIGIIKQKLFDPQQWNAYGYSRNNPLRFMDPTGQYVTNCATDDKNCNKAADNFEKQRQKDLKSKDKNVPAGAAAFGDRGKDNGVHIGFADLASQGIKGAVDAVSNSGNGKTDVEVTIDSGLKGKSLQETIAHEGTHVLTDLNFLNSFDKDAGMYNGLLNVTHGETEAFAYQAGAGVTREHGFGPNDTQQIREFLRTNPTYAPILNVPSFPSNAKFPQTDDPASSGVPFQ